MSISGLGFKCAGQRLGIPSLSLDSRKDPSVGLAKGSQISPSDTVVRLG